MTARVLHDEPEPGIVRSVFNHPDKLNALLMPSGGFEIALCCDVLICAASAQLGLPEGLLGLSSGRGGTQRLARAVGKYLTSDMMLAARRIIGERAFQVGLVAEVVEDADVLTAAIGRARAMLKVAPRAAAEMKHLIRLGPDAALPLALAFKQEVLARLYGSAAGQEGIVAFLDKREPLFWGG